MMFVDLQNELISVTSARFKEAQRPSVKQWINHRYAILWGMDNWTFKKKTAAVTATANNATLTVPTDIGVVWRLWAADGTPVPHLDSEEFFDLYYGQTATALVPDYYTIVNKVLTVGPIPSTTQSTWQLYYERTPWVGNNPLTGPPLVADSDVPLIPTEYHYMLVPAATSIGAVSVNDFTYQFAEQEWQNDLEALRRAYLRDQRGDPRQWGGDPIPAWTF